MVYFQVAPSSARISSSELDGRITTSNPSFMRKTMRKYKVGDTLVHEQARVAHLQPLRTFTLFDQCALVLRFIKFVFIGATMLASQWDALDVCSQQIILNDLMQQIDIFGLRLGLGMTLMSLLHTLCYCCEAMEKTFMGFESAGHRSLAIKKLSLQLRRRMTLLKGCSRHTLQ
ncbi:hypothetical protein AMTR_s00088p00159890 [Amborella trichopoda]|uniref:Uncharacterized protein n=1 Tax=Amborella trichopoda TaxID=13333 RepID=W1NWF8_AMBTC|nr:hypothetical protein AMTR_s00088p00159890 [Amborella trichopoda]